MTSEADPHSQPLVPPPPAADIPAPPGAAAAGVPLPPESGGSAPPPPSFHAVASGMRGDASDHTRDTSDEMPAAAAALSRQRALLILSGLLLAACVALIVMLFSRGGTSETSDIASGPSAIAEQEEVIEAVPATAQVSTPAAATTGVPEMSTTLAPTTLAPTTLPPATSPPTTPPPETAPPTAPPDPEVVSLQRLESIIAADAPTVAAVAESWVPQLGAKQLGTVWQGVTYNYQEILAEHQRLRDAYGAVLVDGSTYNFRLNDQPMAGWFISLVPQAYGDPGGALAWCTAQRIDKENCFAKLVTNNQDAGQTIRLND